MKHNKFLALCAGATLLVLWACQGGGGSSNASPELFSDFGGPQHIKTLEEFRGNVEEADGKVLVDFYATWCGPCKMLKPELKAFASEHPEVKVLKVDVDQAEKLARKFHVSSIPTLILFEDGDKVAETKGFMKKADIEEFAGVS